MRVVLEEALGDENSFEVAREGIDGGGKLGRIEARFRLRVGNAGATLQAAVGGVGPFELDGVGAEGAGLPGADVADFAVVVVVPPLAGNGIGDGFAEFVRRGGGKRVESGDAAEAAGAARVRHHGVEDVVVDGVVIAAENFAGGAAALGDGDSGRKEDEVERVGGCGR